MEDGVKHTLDDGIRESLKTYYEETVRQLVEILNSQLKAKDKQLEVKDEQLKDMSHKYDRSEKSRERLEKRIDDKNQQVNYLFNEMRKHALHSGEKKEELQETHAAEVRFSEASPAPEYRFISKAEQEEETHLAAARQISKDVTELSTDLLKEKLEISHSQAHRLIELLKGEEVG